MGSSDGRRLRAALVIGAALCIARAPAVGLNQPSQFCSGDPCVIASPKDADPNIVLDFGTRAVVLQSTLTMLPQPNGALGSLTIRAGSFTLAGTAGQLRGFSSSGPGGWVTIETVNDIQIDSTVSSGAIRLSGQDGGVLVLASANGSVRGTGRVSIFGDGLFASGGALQISAANQVSLSGSLELDGGLQGAGGEIDVTAGGDVALTGAVDLTGGGGGAGFLTIDTGGSVTLGTTDISGAGEFGDAGLAAIDAGGNVTFQGVFRGRGSDDGENCGDGADLDVIAVGEIRISQEIDLRGRGLDCSGGFLTLAGDRVLLTSSVRLSATGPDGDGGDLDVAADSLIRISGTVALDGGSSGAGDLLLVSSGAIEITGVIDATGRTSLSNGADGATISGSAVTISGRIDASGGSSAAAGSILIDGCDVTTTSTAVLRALGGAGGAIAVTATDTVSLRGSFTSRANELRHSTRANPPVVAGTFSPPLNRVLDANLPPCRECETAAHCDDGNPCSTDTCSAAHTCVRTLRTSGPCEDGNLCTGGDTCDASGTCVAGPPVTCNDDNVCTTDLCVESAGCVFVPAGGTCDDGDTCTSDDRCLNGACTGTPKDCSDGNPCTDDVCTAGVCSNPFNTAPCGSGNACTTNDRCSNGSCVAGLPLDCNDHDSCTLDACDPVAGCTHTPVVGCSDTDGDGEYDDFDPCTTRVWTAPPVRPPDQNPIKFGVLLNRLAAPPGAQVVVMKGQFNVAPSAPLGIDPALNGVHIYAEDAGGALFDVSIPGGSGCIEGDGWETRGAGFKKTWRYRNRSGALPPGCEPGSARGVQSVQIKDRRLSGKAALQFKLKAKLATLLRNPSEPLTRLQFDFALGAQATPGIASPQARAGQCAESVFTGTPIPSAGRPYCKTKLRDGKLNGVKCGG